jgi:uncharacterized protein (TIGR03086 family)
MSDLVARAAVPLTDTVRTLQPSQLGAPTPCKEFDVRGLLNHLLFWGPTLAGAGRKEHVPLPAEAESDVDLTQGDWSSDLLAQSSRTVVAWSEPSAWEGMTRMGGPAELPAAMIGRMIMVELAVHGWDLARAAGRRPSYDDELLDQLYDEVAKNAGQGREMGVFGPEVPVPDSAPTLDRVLGLTGRDPAWTP